MRLFPVNIQVTTIGDIILKMNKSIEASENIFIMQKQFIDKARQGIGPNSLKLYNNLIKEEFAELQKAVDENNLAEILDGAIDLIYVTAGLVNSLGIDGMKAFRIIHESNMAKLENKDKIVSRKDKKVLKPEGWKSPKDKLKQLLNKRNGAENA